MGLEIIVGIASLLIGAAISFLLMRGKNNAATERANKEADRVVEEARKTADRKLNEAKSRADKIVSKAESKNEAIKQKKIQEAKDKFNNLRSRFEQEKAQHKVDMKDREVDLVKQETAFKQKQEKFQGQIKQLDNRKSELETHEAEVKSIRENLEKQLKIVARKKEELDAANEERIQLLEKVANLTEAEAREQLLEAVKAKADTDAMALVKDTINQAKITANKEAKKIVIQSIQRMCAEYTIENTVSVFNLDSDDLKGQIIGREGRNILTKERSVGLSESHFLVLRAAFLLLSFVFGQDYV
ncbi:MAG: Rnase Y domain-containing protein, partial [Bacteroidota bacterium]